MMRSLVARAVLWSLCAALVAAGAIGQEITGVGGGPTGGAVGGTCATSNALAKFTAAQTLACSIATESGTVLTVSNTVNVVTGYQVGGVALAATNLSNGVTGAGAVVLANTPTLITPVLGVASATTLTTTSVATAQFGGAATSGFFIDPNNIALRLAAGAASGRFIFQTASGAATFGSWGAAGLRVGDASPANEALDVLGNTIVSGFVQISNQSAPSTPSASSRLFFDASNRFSWKGTNGFVRTFDGTANTADRIYVLPDLAGTIALTANNLSVFAATTSAQLLSVLSDETGSGLAVFNITPTFITPVIGAATGTSVALTALSKINANAAALPTALTGALLQIGHPDGTTGDLVQESAAAGSRFIGRRSGTSFASPTATAAGATIAVFGAMGHTGSAYTTDTAGDILVASDAVWAVGDTSTKVLIRTTPIGSTTRTTVATFGSNGSLAITGAFSATTGSFAGDVAMAANKITFTDNTGSIGSSNTTTRPANIWFGTLISGPKFTTTGTGTLSGYTLADAESVGVSTSGTAGNIQFRGNGNGYGMDISPGSGMPTIGVMRFANTANATSGQQVSLVLNGTMAPGSGSGSAAWVHINPTINGTSSGKATALAVASKTNTLTGGTINLVDLGTTTTDYFTGYTQKFNVLTDGTTTLAGHLQSSTTAPAVSNTTANSCGTTAATIVGTDVSGKITVGATAGTSCTVTFTTAWTNAPACTVTNETTANLLRATSTTTTVILAGTMVAGDVLAYICLGRV